MTGVVERDVFGRDVVAARPAQVTFRGHSPVVFYKGFLRAGLVAPGRDAVAGKRYGAQKQGV